MFEKRAFHWPAALGIAALALGASASGALAFSASFNWCGAGSPSFRLADVPPETATLQFAMTDLNVPSFHHGGGTVAYHGQSEVPCGAFSSGFVGPSPPAGQVHTYVFTIKCVHHQGAGGKRRAADDRDGAAQISGVGACLGNPMPMALTSSSPIPCSGRACSAAHH